ncbi:flippase [Colwellia sp. E2M01]|uniref:flippase n=1 Tax=Colwellia sp. E2M01 TaxID=2841561 RepID=UPI001C0A1EFE|nr:flippase [Colwellia sp. E2M01]MBU2870946.1 flippase [Colwellia sp. E2M01]
MKFNTEFNFNQLKKNIFTNSLLLLFEKILLLAGGLLLSVLFARLLGPEDFGRYNYILSLVALCVPIYSLGIGNILLRELNEQHALAPTLLTSCFKARFLTGIFVTIVVITILFYMYGASWKPQLITLLLFANIFNAFEVYEKWFQHKSNINKMVYWRASCFIFFTLLKVIMIYQYESYIVLLVIMSLEVVTKNIGYYFLYKKYTKITVEPKFNKKLFLNVFSQSKYLIVSSLAAVVYLKIDILMLESMVDSKTVGIYSVAAKISEIWYILPQVVITALFPTLISLAKSNNKRYFKTLQSGFDLLFISAVIISTLIYIFSPMLIQTLYGDDYSEASTILRIHIFSCIFIYMRILLSHWFVSQKLAKFSLFSQVSGAVVNVVLNLLLIPAYGALGAAIATLISYAVSAYVCLFLFKKTRVIALMMTKSILFIFRLHKVDLLSSRALK